MNNNYNNNIATSNKSKITLVMRLMICCCFCCYITNSMAQQATAVSKNKEYLIGDWVPIDITVTAPINAKIFFPNFEKKDSNLTNIEVVNSSEVDTVKDGTVYRYHKLVNFIVFDTGKILFQPFPIVVQSNGTIDTIFSDAVAIHVAGVAIDTTKDIKPIKAPIKVPITLREIAPYLLALAIVMALIAFIVWWIKRRKTAKVPVDLKYILPPDVWALQELDKIEQQRLWQQGEIKHFYSLLSDILRNYIELRFRVPAMEQTTDEIMQSLHKGIMKQKLKQPIQEFLMMSDFVKFAKAQPDFTDNEKAVPTLKEFIHQTKPIETKETTK